MAVNDSAPAAVSAFATYRRLLGYAARHWPIALLAIVGMVFDAGVATAFTRLIKPMLDDLFVRRDAQTILWMPVAIMVLFIVRGAATFATDFGMARIGRGVVRQLREEVFAHYQRLPASWF